MRKVFKYFLQSKMINVFEIGLKIDIVKQGSGTSNDGNTARRFFEDPSFAAQATGLDETLIKNFRVILVAMSSGKEIDAEKFRKYCAETADNYKSLYNWYYMPPSVHKVINSI